MRYMTSHNDTVTLNRYDAGGAMNVLARRVGDIRADELDERSYYAGAFNALYILTEHDDLRDQTEFFAALDGLMDALPGGDESGED